MVTLGVSQLFRPGASFVRAVAPMCCGMLDLAGHADLMALGNRWGLSFQRRTVQKGTLILILAGDFSPDVLWWARQQYYLVRRPSRQSVFAATCPRLSRASPDVRGPIPYSAGMGPLPSLIRVQRNAHMHPAA
jgi:hypothetical protein